MKERRIGPIGTGSRVLIGLALLYLAGGASGLSWGLEWYDPMVGFIALPAVVLTVGLLARRRGTEPVRLTGAFWVCVNCAVIILLVANPYTGGGALLFYGATLLVAAWRGQPGCEATVLPNLILRRDDQIGCPTFSPIDEGESRLSARKARLGDTRRAREA